MQGRSRTSGFKVVERTLEVILLTFLGAVSLAGCSSQPTHPEQPAQQTATQRTDVEADSLEDITAALKSDGIDVDNYFEKDHIKKYHELGARVTEINALLALDGEDGRLFEDVRQLLKYKDLGGTAVYAQTVCAWKKQNGSRFVDQPHKLISLREAKLSIDDLIKFRTFKDDEGKRIYDWHHQIMSFVEAGGTAQIAERLLSYRDDNGYALFDSNNSQERFVELGSRFDILDGLIQAIGMPKSLTDGWPIMDYIEHKGTLADAKRLKRLCSKHEVEVDYDDLSKWKKSNIPDDYMDTMLALGRGDLLFSVSSVVEFFDNGGTIENVRRLKRFKDSEGQPLFELFLELEEWQKQKVPFEVIEQFSKITDRKGKNVFTGYGICRAYEAKLPLDVAMALAKITDQQGHSLMNGREMTAFYAASGTVKDVQDLATIVDQQGNPVYKGGVFTWWKKKDVPLAKMKALAQIKTTKGQPFFGMGLTFFEDIEKAESFARRYVSVVNCKGQRAFEARDFRDFDEHKVPLDYVRKVALLADPQGNLQCGVQEIIITYQLGFAVNQRRQFKDTEKPNALLVLATNDWNGATRNKEAIAFYRSVMEAYDTRFVFASREQQLYSALDSTPNIELLVIAGHGSKTTLSFGEEDLARNRPKKGEEYTLSVDDQELETHLHNLRNPRVFLFSCSNGEGQGSEENLSNFIYGLVKRKGYSVKLFSGRKPFGAPDFRVSRLYPFEMKIRKQNIHKTREIDLTYIPN